MNQRKNKQKIQSTRYIPPPVNLPVYRDRYFKNVTYIGETNYLSALGNKIFVFGIKKRDRKKNIFVLGVRQTGKSKLIESICRQDVENNYGFILFDQKGDLFRSVLKNIPSGKINNFYILDFSNEKMLPAFNPFFNVSPLVRGVFIESFVNLIFSYSAKHLWNFKMHFLWRMIVMAMIDFEKGNLLNVLDLIDDVNYRKEVIGVLKEKNVKNFWEENFDKFKEFYKDEIVSIKNFIYEISANDNLKKVFSFVPTDNQPAYLNIESLIDKNSFILINVPLGFFDMRLAGFIRDLILLKVKNAGVARGINQALRKTFYIYFDGIRTENSLILEDFLENIESYNFSFILSAEHLRQMPPSLVSKIFDNAENLIFFRLAGEDASRAERELFSFVKARDIANLNKREFYIRMLIGENVSDPFSARTLNIAESVQNAATENEILKHMREFLIPNN